LRETVNRPKRIEEGFRLKNFAQLEMNVNISNGKMT
jgi:hypothetical protein